MEVEEGSFTGIFTDEVERVDPKTGRSLFLEKCHSRTFSKGYIPGILVTHTFSDFGNAGN